VVFLTAGFLVAGLAATFLAGALAADFLAVLLAPAALALAERADFWRAALFLWMTAFLAAWSIALTALRSASAMSAGEPLARTREKALIASLIERLVLTLRRLAFWETLTRFLADLMIGTLRLTPIKEIRG